VIRRLPNTLLMIVGLTLAGVLGGCVPQDRSLVTEGAPTDVGYQVGVDATLLEEGRQLYETHCAGCHGATGDGKGPAARVLHPPPRNFITAKFKFSSRRSGELPTDQDLFDTISTGLKGSSMPNWKLLPDRERWSLVTYIKTFSDRWETDDPAGAIPVGEDPYAVQADKSDAIARGEAVYHGLATCWTCHPAYVSENRINEYLKQFENPPRDEFREDLYEAVARLSSEGNVVYVPNFHRDFVRAGRSLTTLYRSIAAGISGTAMPTWVDSIEIRSSSDELLSGRDDLWALAYYVQAQVAQRPPRLAEGSFKTRDRRMDTSLPDTWQPVEAKALSAEAGGGDDEEEEEEEE
jgi:Cytochrome c